MSLTTWEVTLDLDGSGSYATDITAYVWRFDSLRISGRGRRADLGAASPATLTLSLDNSDGRFSPKNTGGAYYNTFHPYAGIRVRATYNAITYDLFKGIITGIGVKPHINDALVYVTAADFMWALERTSVRLPLMENHHPGVIIDRLLDHAEIGEHVDNPIFKDDLTGYSVLGTGTNTRVTTGIVLEAPAALESVTTAVTSGWRYTIPHSADSEFQSVKVQASCYVWTPLPADEGETFTIRLGDSVGVIATATVTLTSQPQRVTVSGTFNGAATDFYIDGYMTSAAATFRTGAVHCVTFGNAYARSTETGMPTLERVFFHEVSALSAIQEVALNELGGLFYFDGAGVATFEERTHRWAASRSLTSQVTIDERFKELAYNEDATDRVGEVILSYPIWEKAATEETIASVAPLPRAIPPNDTLRVEIDFGGATARDIVKPVANTDYFINANPGGGGADESGNVTLAWDTFGGGAQAVFTNTVARTVHLISPFNVRGKPVRREDGASPARATPTTVVPYAAVLSFSFGLNGSEAHMQSWANYLAARHGDTQRENIAIAMADPFGDMPLTGLTAAMLAAKVSDRITLTNDNMPTSTKVNADFYIDSLDLAIAGQEIAATWRLVPVDLAYFIIDTDSIDGAKVLAP